MSEAVLVTGGAGYVGSHVCQRLAEEGFLPITLDNLSAGHRWAVRWGPLVAAEVSDAAALAAVIERHKPVAVMHFAGLISVADSVTDPIAYFRTNLGGSIALIEAARARGVSKLVFSSSAAVYGEPRAVPLVEDHPREPINPYGASKLMVERVLADVSAAQGFRSVSLRYFNAAGADPAGEIGEDHDPETHLIPRVLDAALGRGRAIDIYGDDYDTPDGTCVRDYVHVCDLADAHLLALRYLLAGGATTCLNLGNAKGCSVREVIEAARRATGQEIAVEIGPRRAGDPAVLIADSRAAAATLGWRPTRSAIERVIEDAWRWHRRHFGR